MLDNSESFSVYHAQCSIVGLLQNLFKFISFFKNNIDSFHSFSYPRKKWVLRLSADSILILSSYVSLNLSFRCLINFSISRVLLSINGTFQDHHILSKILNKKNLFDFAFKYYFEMISFILAHYRYGKNMNKYRIKHYITHTCN